VILQKVEVLQDALFETNSMKPRRALLEADIRFANTAAGLDETGAVRMLAISDLYDQMGKSCRRPSEPRQTASIGD
jgi:hypothetical protein